MNRQQLGAAILANLDATVAAVRFACGPREARQVHSGLLGFHAAVHIDEMCTMLQLSRKAVSTWYTIIGQFRSLAWVVDLPVSFALYRSEHFQKFADTPWLPWNIPADPNVPRHLLAMRPHTLDGLAREQRVHAQLIPLLRNLHAEGRSDELPALPNFKPKPTIDLPMNQRPHTVNP